MTIATVVAAGLGADGLRSAVRRQLLGDGEPTVGLVRKPAAQHRLTGGD